MIQHRELRRGGLAFVCALAIAQVAQAQTQADLPPNARAGECYARVFVPPQYETATEQVLRREASDRIEIEPARYTWAEEQVLVQAASTRLVEVPAVYETLTETIEIEPARTEWFAKQRGRSSEADAELVSAARRLGVPSDARPGECFAEHLTPARYETRSEQVVKSPADERIEIVPARYDWVEERVMIKESSTKVVEVPAVYETISEQVLVKPAHQVWKKGRGPIERVDHATGEIMCLVDVPAKYETVTKRVLKAPATTKTVEIPAEYKMVKVRKMVSPAQEKRIPIPAQYETISRRSQTAPASRTWLRAGASGEGKPTGLQLCLTEIPAKTRTVSRRVLKTPATTRTVEVPAQYETVKVRKLAEPARERRVEVPAQYATVQKSKLVRDGHMSWVPVLCETNATPGLVSNIQRALRNAGHDPGPIDGVFGQQTMSAIRAFQQKKGLQTGGVTVATLEALGIDQGQRRPDVAGGPPPAE